MNVSAEFLVEPFRPGSLGPHVSAAVDAIEAAGVVAEVGTNGTSVAGELSTIVTALAEAIAAAMTAGASQITLKVTPTT